MQACRHATCSSSTRNLAASSFAHVHIFSDRVQGVAPWKVELRLLEHPVLLAASSDRWSSGGFRPSPPYPVPDPGFNNTTVACTCNYIKMHESRCLSPIHTDFQHQRHSYRGDRDRDLERSCKPQISNKSCSYAARSPPQPYCKGKNSVRRFSSALPYTCPELEPKKPA